MASEGRPPGIVWASGDAYEPYVGRWSRLVAREFLAWLDQPKGGRWLDVGCGTGALASAILASADPAAVHGVDPSDGFLATARRNLIDPRVRLENGNAMNLPVESAAYDAVVSGLVLNFVPKPAQAAAEMRRAVRPGGTVALYVWDYGGEMQMMRHFWDAAVALDPAAQAKDESARFPLCNPAPLESLFRTAGFKDVALRAIDVPTVFRDFDDYWTPFLSGQAPAPGYNMSLSEDRRAALRERLRATLPFEKDGTLRLIARAWAIRGVA
jgi:SAM-dependent methyltransferase